jgi:hypothetical protein
MANRYAVATGNWSDTATWDGGTLPTAGDVVRPNGFVVTIDVDVTVDELINNASAPAVAGGSFTLSSAGITITAVSIYAAANGFNLINASYGGGTSTLIGNLGGSASFASEAVSVQGQAGGRLVIIGNLTGHGSGFSGIFNAAVALEGNGAGFILEVTGTVQGSGGTYGCGLGVQSGYNVILNGIITGSFTTTNVTAAGVYIAGSSNTVTVNSYMINSSAPAIYATGTINNLILVGDCVSNGVNNTVVTDTNVTVTLKGKVTNHLNRVAVYAPKIIIGPTASVWETYAIDAGTNKTLYTADELTGYPPEAKVENGEVYGPANEFEGTLDPVTISAGQIADLANAVGLHLTPQVLAAITGLP